MFGARQIVGGLLFVFAGSYCTVGIAAEVTLKAVTALPGPSKYNNPFTKFFVNRVKELGKDSVAIQYLGGPEVIPVQEQLKAVTRGVVDIFYGPGSYYLGEVPEIYALNGSNLHAAEIRSNGGLALLNKAFNKKAAAELIGYYASGYSFYIYTKKEPKLSSQGTPNLKGLNIRGDAKYQKLYQQFGASAVLIHLAEMYSALERGVVDGIGWPGAGLIDFGWDKFLKYRITPAFWQGDIVMTVNKRKWDGLTDEGRRVLTRAASDAENWAHAYFVRWSKEEAAALDRKGMKSIDLKGSAAETYKKAAYEFGVWEPMKQYLSVKEIEALKAKVFRP